MTPCASDLQKHNPTHLHRVLNQLRPSFANQNQICGTFYILQPSFGWLKYVFQCLPLSFWSHFCGFCGPNLGLWSVTPVTPWHQDYKNPVQPIRQKEPPASSVGHRGAQHWSSTYKTSHDDNAIVGSVAWLGNLKGRGIRIAEGFEWKTLVQKLSLYRYIMVPMDPRWSKYLLRKCLGYDLGGWVPSQTVFGSIGGI